MKRQIIVIHGGDSFTTHKRYISFLRNYRIDSARYRSGKKDWKSNLGRMLGRNFEIMLPTMPNKSNARYAEWKLWFQKFTPHLKSGIILIGHSLGGLFLVKYLSEKTFPKKIRAIFLVASPQSEGDFVRPKTFKRLEKQAGKIFLYHSKDDRVVPFADFKKYRKNLGLAVARVFSRKGHFNQEKFPELVKDIRSLYLEPISKV